MTRDDAMDLVERIEAVTFNGGAIRDMPAIEGHAFEFVDAKTVEVL